MPRGKTKKESPVKIQDTTYSISITFGNDTFSGVGDTALEAIKSMPLPIKITTKGLVEMTNGEKRVKIMLQPRRLRRLFYPLSQSFFAKQLSYLMK